MQSAETRQNEDRLADLAEKALAALHRSIPATRMRDYGMNDEDVGRLSTLPVNGPDWDVACEEIAAARIASAEAFLAQGHRQRASQYFEWAGAALNIGQLAFNHDSDRKLALLERSNTLFCRASEQADASYRRAVLHDGDRRILYGWEFPAHKPSGCVVIVGGLSGWGSAYFSMARAFNARGLAAIIVEGPGQGETRSKSRIFLSRKALSCFAPVVDRAVELGGGPVGIFGNSFGGLIAAHIAAVDSRILACGINGAPPRVVVPDFRTAREQIEAAFDAQGEALSALVADFGFDPAATPLRQAVLIVEGGADPLVPLGSQAAFVAGGAAPTTLTWEDGQHTIYNHAGDRNALISAWYADELGNAGQTND